MNSQMSQVNVQYKDALVQRLVEHYLAHRPLPGQDKALTPELFYRLYRAITGEGYGG